VVLSFRRVKTKPPARSRRTIGAAFAVAVLTLLVATAPAPAQGITSGGCIGGRNSFNCVTLWGGAGDPYIRIVPPPRDAAAAALAQERERRWVDRCRPIIEPDVFGVPRYRYAAPGCEFGVGAN
jgi:hypothetical protein